MPRQMGARAQLLAKLESVYGTAPSGNWQQMPVESYNLQQANDLIKDPAIGFATREMIDPQRGPISVKGQIVAPVDVRNIGIWLKALLGGYSVSGTGTFTHVFKPEETTSLPSLSCELGYADVGDYFVHAGLVIDKATLSFQGAGPSRISMDAIAQTETKSASSGGGVPTDVVYTPFSQKTGALFRDAAGTTAPATAIAQVTAATLSMNNNINAEPGVGTNGLILGADAQQFEASGEVTMRFADTSIYDLAVAGTFEALSFGYTIDASHSLTFVLPRVSFGRFGVPLAGPNGISVKAPFQASRDTGTGASVIATLVNDVATY